MAMDAFDLAEELQTPVFVMSDLDLGMNYWMSDPFPYPDQPLKRGKVLSADDLDRLGGFERYRDVDGDGVGYRTLPGNPHAASGYFTRGSGHNAQAIYSEKPDVYVDNMQRLERKWETARRSVPAPLIEDNGHDIGLIAYGTSHWAVIECQDQLAREYGVHTDYCRIRAFPFHDDVAAFVRRHRRVYVVEQNRDAQIAALLRLSLTGEEISRLRNALHYNGLPIDARSITDNVMTQEVGS
jgi:2-oxoglutarate ferredoxin oxidoreductase subunit alpha